MAHPLADRHGGPSRRGVGLTLGHVRPARIGRSAPSGQHRFRRWVGPSVLVVLALAALVPLGAVGGGSPPAAPTLPLAVARTAAPATSAPPATARPAPTPAAYVGAALAPPTPRPTLRPTPRPTTAVTPPATPFSPSVPTAAAPKAIQIGFPLAAGTRYRYRNNYGELRPGAVEPYNHVFDVRDGSLRRAHDGIDIYAARGTHVLAPFSGRVIDPAERWSPWRPERYGTCVVIVSTEPATMGYAALLCHLDSSQARIGTKVRRGKVVGTLGVSGNAESSPAQLHLELRAPAPLAWPEAGGTRPVDAFNPYRSLRLADPAVTN